MGQKLTLNHPSLVDEGEETRVFVTAHKRERKKRESSTDVVEIALTNIDRLNYIRSIIFQFNKQLTLMSLITHGKII